MREVNIKAGSGSLVQGGKLNHDAFARISQQARRFAEQGRVVITSSGFAAAGGGKGEEEYQIGKGLIMAAWHEHLGDRAGSLQLVSRLTLAASVEAIQIEQDRGLVPIANGQRGDRCFGSNDQLSVLLAGQLGLKHVVLLGDQEAFYSSFEDQSRRKRLEQVDLARISEYHQFVQDASAEGTGGMLAKFDAAQYAAENGMTCHYGHWQADIEALINGSAGTTFANGIGATL
jgi:glutamate 5-kinase